MRILFMGSSPVSCVCLEALLEAGHDVACVVTQPDRPRGRNMSLSPGPVKALAISRGLTAVTPQTVNAPEILSELAAFRTELTVVVAFGQILRRAALDLSPLGCINVHASLLPKYRGAAPIQWAIADGEPVTGITIMHMSERLDAGDMIIRAEEPIGADDTAGALQERLSRLGGRTLVSAVAQLSSGAAPRAPQDESAATYARKLVKEDGRIDWTRPAAAIERRIRAFSPWPGSQCFLPGGSTLKIVRAAVEAGAGEPGQVIDCGADGPLVGTGSGALRLAEVQPEGKKPMAGAAFLCGRHLKQGDFLA